MSQQHFFKSENLAEVTPIDPRAQEKLKQYDIINAEMIELQLELAAQKKSYDSLDA